ncbi:MAG: T9SS type A sorting domain-containing protein [Bacteroidetes bacterium]|nr:T9SS type A sorting domain-containing protein [Bacteroidota bacterium]
MEVMNKGIEVICVAGDIGKKVKQFEYQTTDGVWFLASGISAGDSGNKVLIIENNLTAGILQWEFIPIEQVASINAEPLMFNTDCFVYPNPSDGRGVTIETSEECENYSATFYSLAAGTSMKIIGIHSGKNTIDASMLIAGLYLLELLDEKGNIVKRQKIIVR